MNMPNSQFYRERAADTAREAATTLDPTVRQRLREVENAWLILSKGAASVEAERKKR
ncbi:hypothetical protein [Aureimonas leprariae]|uniref:hypothetical protein n=1 Tax=Plantimonas leprariae TaxID=2615207 RepID=UPI00192A2BB9|nr:hypothetical protein [Aureimonas leprariae]